MFADNAKIFIKSGKGGDGHVSFRRELYVPAGGPDGGDGGKGGDIIFQVDKGKNTLSDFRHVRKYVAKDGQEGGKRRCHGADGKDLVIKVPEGTVITMTGSNGDSQTITLPYTFPAGSSDSYTITYETDAPQGEPGQSWTVSNKAELEGDDDHYEAGGDVSGQTQGYSVGKSFDGIDQNESTDEVGIYKWVSRITVPKAGVELDKLTYTDTLIDATVNGETVAGSHYITAVLLDKIGATAHLTG